jgi:hypothetical protein
MVTKSKRNLKKTHSRRKRGGGGYFDWVSSFLNANKAEKAKKALESAEKKKAAVDAKCDEDKQAAETEVANKKQEFEAAQINDAANKQKEESSKTVESESSKTVESESPPDSSTPSDTEASKTTKMGGWRHKGKKRSMSVSSRRIKKANSRSRSQSHSRS